MPDFCSRRHPFNYVTALNTLMKLGIDTARVNLLAVGLFESYKGGILHQEPDPGQPLGPNTEITLHVGCYSAVDHTAYQFFYGLEGGRERGDEWETQARELMAPFDAAMVRFEALARHEAHKFNLGIVDRDFLFRFLELFDFHPSGTALDLRELLFWVSVLPAAHLWAGNARGVAAVLTRLLGCPVEITESISSRFDLPEECRSPLGSTGAGLGGSLVLGRSFVEQDSTYEVVVEGVPVERLASFLPGMPDRLKLEWLLGVCMPSHLEYRIRVTSRTRRHRIGRAGGAFHLGYGSYISGSSAAKM